MKHNDDYNLKLLYKLAGEQPYHQGASYVVPDTDFKISYPTPSNQGFVLTIIPQYKKKKK